MSQSTPDTESTADDGGDDTASASDAPPMPTGADRDAATTTAADRVTVPSTVPLTALLAEEQTLPFCGLTPADPPGYPAGVAAPADSARFAPDTADEQLSLKDVIQRLPKAGEGQLWADNEFVTADGSIDTAALRAVHGLDVDQLEAAAGAPLDDLVASVDPDAQMSVADHKDIIDRRRLALHTLGYDVKFRWQIASDRYDAGDPQEFLLPMIGAFQQRGATDAFGWCRFRDWGGEVKLTVIFPSLAHEVTPPEELDDLDELVPDATGLTTASGGSRGRARDLAARIGAPTPDADDDATDPTTDESEPNPDTDADANTVSNGSDGSDPSDDIEHRSDAGADDEPGVTIYHGYQLGYDFRGTQTVWAKPLIFVPGIDVIIPGVGRRYSRRHVGDLTDAAHERQQNRMPIMEWHRSLFDDQQKRAVSITRDVLRSRLLAVDFAELPFEANLFYDYLGLPGSYAEAAADRATRLASPASAPTLWNLQLSLKLELLDEYEGSRASDRYQEFQELAGQLLRQPGQMISLALREHELRIDDDAESDEQSILADDQETLPGAIEELVDVPGINAGSETDLSVTDSQRVEDHVQQRLDDLSDSR